MQSFSVGSIPLFLRSLHRTPADIRTFDAMYLSAPVVGLHVLGAEPETILGLLVEEVESGIRFFAVYDELEEA